MDEEQRRRLLQAFLTLQDNALAAAVGPGITYAEIREQAQIALDAGEITQEEYQRIVDGTYAQQGWL